jgi:hypothetical protein
VAAVDAASGGCCCVPASLRSKTLGVMLEIRGIMGQCESKDQDFKEQKRRKASKNKKEVRF